MKVELREYGQYQAAGIEYLDRIPKTWQLRPLKTTLKKKRGAIKAGPFGTQLLASEMTTEGPVKVLNQRNVIDGDLINGENFVSEEKFSQLRAFEVCVGDLLLTTRGTIGKTCLVGSLPGQAILHPCLIRIQADGRIVLAEYLMMLLGGTMVQDQLQILSNATTIEVIYTETLKRVVLPMPSLDEQRSILAFLDSETAKIDRLMEVRRKQVERLQEQRAALIHHAVTKGLDRDAKMISADLPWATSMPVHWGKVRLKFLGRITLGKMMTNSDTGGMSLCPYLKARNVRWESVDVSDVDEMWFSPSDMKSLLIKTADLVVTEGGEVGRAAIWKGELDACYLQNSVHKITLRKPHEPEYILYQFYAAGHAGHFDAIVNRISIAHLTGDKLAEIFFLVPPPDEQREIVAHIKRETAKLDTLITKYQRELELLAEYRASLISHAVTGKIDVRGIVQSEEATDAARDLCKEPTSSRS